MVARKTTEKSTVKSDTDNASDTAVVHTALTDVALYERPTDTELRGIGNLEDAMAFMAERYGAVEAITERLGNGFSILKDKKPLVGVPFYILYTDLIDGEFGEFATMAVITADTNQRRFIVNDGSTGIYQQVTELREQRAGGFFVPQGLRESTYATCPSKEGGCGRARDERKTECPHCGNDSTTRGTGSTYYLDTSAAA